MDASAGPSSSKPKKSKPKPRDLLEYTWYLKSVHKTADNTKTTFHAGAICVHPDGFLVTVTHGITLPKFKDYPSIKARRQPEKFRSVELIEGTAWQSFGLTLLKVKKISAEDEFKAFPISSNTSIDPTKSIPIHGFIFQDMTPFSYVYGKTSYRYPNNLRMPTNPLSPCTYDGDFTERTISSFTDPGTIWSPRDISRFHRRLETVGDGIYEACQHLNGTIPLLQVSGLDEVAMDGQIGWPVFTEDNKVLLGLIFLPTKTRQFVIPAEFVSEVIHRHHNWPRDEDNKRAS